MQSIDLVIPMVFPDDPEWQREYTAANRGGRKPAAHATGVVGRPAAYATGVVEAAANVRFRSWGTEELLVRCCMKFMPWLRRIHLLLASESQVQPWMRRLAVDGGGETLAAKTQGTLPAVRLVFHREFIPGEWLPCFSSPCIEMFLHRIPGLAERFIYANDDMFPLSPLEPDDFFYYKGTNVDGAEQYLLCSPLLPCQHLYERPYPNGPNIFQRKCMWQQNMIGADFGRHYTRTWLRNGHSFAAILKSSCEEVWCRHGEEIRRNLSPVRRTDRSANHYIYQLYQQFSGRYVEHEVRKQYVGEKVTTDRLAAIISDPKAGIVCINDNEHETDWQQRAEIVRREIAEKLKN